MPQARLYCGDALAVLRTLPTASVQCCITSPPYWGLREYGAAPLLWGGEAGCAHVWGAPIKGRSHSGSLNGSTLQGASPGRHQRARWTTTFCQRCRAWRGCLGSEPTPELYIAHLVEILREVRRVLRDDATLWLNVGDSHSSGGRVGHGTRVGYKQATNRGMNGTCDPPRAPQPVGLKPKDLVGLPWMLAFALRADGWYLRSEIIWHKPNPMPESVQDRPTRSHEQVFLLSKNERYSYDPEAIKEPATSPNGQGFVAGRSSGATGGSRNKRSVWTIATQPYLEAHFATFPEALVLPCLLAGTSAYGACTACGSPWRRRVTRQRLLDGAVPVSGTFSRPDEPFRIPANGKGHYRYSTKTIEHGWRPTCACGVDAVQPCTTLDPFGGSGTVAAVSIGNGRASIYIDNNPAYVALAEQRIGPMYCRRDTRATPAILTSRPA